MERYKIEIKKSAAKEIKKLPSSDIKKILEKISALSENPRPSDCIKLCGEEKYRMRCGDYRVLYMIEDKILLVFVVKLVIGVNFIGERFKS